MRKQLGTVLRSALMVGAIAAMVGCQASASIGAGGAKEPPPPQPEAKKEEPKPVEEAKPKPEFKVVNGQLELPGPVVFVTGKSDIDEAASAPVLDVVVKYLEAKPEITKLRIEGHTDNVGKPDANQTLSEARALAVAKWLIGKSVKCERLYPVGFGQNKPIADNATDEGKAQNRRTAFVNAELRGKAIGGIPLDGGGKVAGDPCK